MVVGLLADDGLPVATAQSLAEDLPQLLADRLSDQVTWDVRVEEQVLTLDEQGEISMVELAEQQRGRSGWDLAVLLTGLPRRFGSEFIVSDCSTKHGVALLSLPALGAVALRHRARDQLVHLIGHLAQDRLALGDQVIEDAPQHGASGRLARRLGPIRHIDVEAEHLDQRLAMPGLRGGVRLLSGMVRDHRPWRLVPHLSTATAAAMATAAYGLITTSFWSIADNLSSWRLAGVNLLAVLAMTGWLLFHNHLWDRPGDLPGRQRVLLDNVSTVVSLLFGVISMYAILYLITLGTGLLVLDNGYLSRALGHAAELPTYAVISWLASSIGIAAGAVGSGLDSEEAMPLAAYSRREQARRATASPRGRRPAGRSPRAERPVAVASSPSGARGFRGVAPRYRHVCR